MWHCRHHRAYFLAGGSTLNTRERCMLSRARAHKYGLKGRNKITAYAMLATWGSLVEETWHSDIYLNCHRCVHPGSRKGWQGGCAAVITAGESPAATSVPDWVISSMKKVHGQGVQHGVSRSETAEGCRCKGCHCAERQAGSKAEAVASRGPRETGLRGRGDDLQMAGRQ